MEKFEIIGMSCAVCSARVEKAVRNVPGVTDCSVNLLTNSMIVEGNATDESIITAVIDAGYEAYKNTREKAVQEDDVAGNKEIKTLKKRLLWSAVFLVFLMYFSMGNMLFDTAYFGIFKDNLIAVGTLQMLLSAVIMVINRKFFINAYKSIRHRAPNMDVLVSMGSLASFLYSVYVLCVMIFSHKYGNIAIANKLGHDFYFESAAMILTLITVGKLLEAYSKGKTTSAIKSLMDLVPKTATVIRDGKEVVIPARDVVLGDVFLVVPGKSIPADGIILEGHSAVDESSLTGESIPADKNVGDTVSAATVNRSGFLKCRATGVGEDTAFAKIIRMVSDASATKAPISKIADKVSGVFVPVVLVIAVITTMLWLISGEGFGFSLSRGICVLVISCPCALGLATPVAIMVGNGVAAKNGVLFKTSAALEETGKISIVALDKTGTITKGEPHVTDVFPVGGTDSAELLGTAYSIEKNSEHPLARAVVKKCEEEGVTLYRAEEFSSLPGSGVKGKINDDVILGGNIRLMEKEAEISSEITSLAEKLSNEGKTPLIFAKNGEIIGIIAVADIIKEDSKKAIAELKKAGLRTVMITGDNRRTAVAVASVAGIDEVVSDVLPDGKEEAIKTLKKSGKVLMVGDGINDAPALTVADIGIAVGAGTDIAIESADVVLGSNSLLGVSTAIMLSKATLRNIKQNLFWAFLYNVIGIPLAAGLWIPINGWELDPMFGAAAMSLSSVCVISNALRLNFFKTNKKEKKRMEITLKIEGMMCPHCEGRVKKALEDAVGVTDVKVSHEKGEAIIVSEGSLTENDFKSIIEAQGYKVI